MKSFAMILSVLLSGAILNSVRASENDTDQTPEAYRTLPGPVSNLRNQDSAFSLLIESYRQMQTFMIEGDYDKRLRAAALVKDPKERGHIETLAAQERELRLAKLHGMLEGFGAAYDTSRRESERAAGIHVESEVDIKAANEKLRKFVPFTPHDFGPGENQPSHLVPAGAQMIYSQRH